MIKIIMYKINQKLSHLIRLYNSLSFFYRENIVSLNGLSIMELIKRITIFLFIAFLSFFKCNHRKGKKFYEL